MKAWVRWALRIYDFCPMPGVQSCASCPSISAVRSKLQMVVKADGGVPVIPVPIKDLNPR